MSATRGGGGEVHAAAPSDVTGATRQNEKRPAVAPKVAAARKLFPFLPAISPGGAASLNHLRCSFKRKCHFHVVSSAAPLIGKWERRQSTAAAVSLVPAKQWQSARSASVSGKR